MAMRTATLGRVIQSAANRNQSPATDRDLLRRFAGDGDQAAFEALVRRHTGLVLGVCRRALTNAQDAEDACQAVFLILARKAGSGRWQPSIANWLFATARRVARDQRRAADRRAKREGRAAVPAAVEPVDQMTGRELLAAIDEELDRLPPIYLEPLLLYHQAELTRDEIAARLGVPAGTVKIRLERGRKRLAAALTRRGVTLGAAVLTLMACSPAGASPPRLIEAIRAAVGGKVPPAVAALAEGAAVSGAIPKVTLGLVLAAAVSALGFGLGEPRAGGGGPPDKAMPAKAAGGTKTEKPALGEQTVAGRVLNADGKPLAGARLYASKRLVDPKADSADGLVHIGAAGADSTFRVTFQAAGRQREYLVAHAPGLGADWVDLGEAKAGEAVTLKLVKDQPITGRVLNTEGKPVAGVSVTAGAIYVPADEKLDDYLAGWRKQWRDAVGTPRKRLYAPLDGVTGPVVTDANGKFILTGAGAERIVHLTLSGKGIAQATPYVITRAGFDAKAYNAAVRDDRPPVFRPRRVAPVLFGPEPTFVTEPGVTVAGVVKDAATGRPVAGCRLSAYLGFGDWINARTDATGAYTIAGLPRDPNGYSVHARPGKDTGYLSRSVRAADTGDLKPVRCDVELVKGAVVTGRVVDRKTGKGVVAGIRFAPLPENQFFGSKPGYDNYRADRTMESTDADGRFRLLTIPGPAVVLVQAQGDDTFHGEYLCPYRRAVPDEADRKHFKYDADDDDWTFTTADGIDFLSVENAAKVIDVKAEGETTVELFLDRGATSTLTVQDADGKPLAGAWVAGITEHWPITYRLPKPTAPVYALDPKKPRLLTVYHRDKKLGGAVPVRGDEKEPVVVKLGPLGSVKGTLTDTDGKPLGGVDVSVRPDGTGSELERFAGPIARAVRTDRDGRFTVTGVVPGMPFRLQVQQGEAFYGGVPKIGQRTVKAGEAFDLGVRKMEPLR